MKKGFTLIEFLIYVAIVGSILVLMTNLFWNVILGGTKENSYQEVQQNGRFALLKMEQEIKKAIGINNPSPGTSASSLSLLMANSSLNPTVFNLNGGKLIITQGSSSPIEITTDQVSVSSLRFTNLSYFGTPGTIGIEMTIENLNPANRNEYQASVDLKTTVSLSKGGAAP
jgi:prepilin-type N-terminal cleavage/methylation domain-containing protein